MSCPDCKDNATPEQILDLIQQHHDRLEAEYTGRLEEAVAEIRRLTETLAAAHETRPAGTPIH
jgi:predicted hydrolase (HD superfamily)